MRPFIVKALAPISLAAQLAPAVRAEEAAPDPHTFTANVGLFSQYVFRGLAQSNEKPALQGGVDYSHVSGVYIGTWLSSISWFSDVNTGNSSSLEWDGYAGYKKSWPHGLTSDIGYLHYHYPGSYAALPAGVQKPNTDELYAGVGWKWASLKYSHAIGDLFGVPDSKGSYYLDLTMTVPLPKQLSLAVHAGRQTFDGAGNDALYSYEDYRTALSYAFGAGWTVGAAYTHTTAKDAGYTVLGKNIGDDQFVVSISRAL